MSSIANTITTGQFAQGLKDLANGVESNDAGDAANALSQILAGIYTAAQPLGDFTGIVNLTAAAITALKIARDANDPNKRVDPLDLLALAGNLAAVTISLGKNHPLLRAANFALGLGQVILGSVFSGDARGEVNPDVNRDFNRGTAWTRPRDPLILDLDGDGIELTPSSAAVLFDHNADQIKTGSQWVKADDALLVRDLDGNGLIDSGRELFGDQTRIEVTRSTFDPNLINANGTMGGMVSYTTTQTAANGFEALRPLDKDGSGASDGQIDASDTAYASLQVWQDLNQDGISQANELRTLAQAGIGSIALNKQTTISINGQSQVYTQRAEDLGVSSFSQSTTTSSLDAQGNPTTATTTTSQAIHNINLASNAFYREFLNNPAVTASAATLPQMQGAGFRLISAKKNCKSKCYKKRSAIKPFDDDIMSFLYKNELAKFGVHIHKFSVLNGSTYD